MFIMRNPQLVVGLRETVDSLLVRFIFLLFHFGLLYSIPKDEFFNLSPTIYCLKSQGTVGGQNQF